MVAPFFMRKRLTQLINKEIDNASEGKKAWIFLKMNSLTDPEMIKKLYEAGQAGVTVRLIVRSICSLVPGIKGVSDNIEVISIVDRYLEHARVFIFANEDDPKCFISSADFMTRNIDFRSEVAVPIYDESIQKILRNILELQWLDNVKGRNINDNTYRKLNSKVRIRSQDAITEYFRNMKL
jgi:polyphosphate kinase